MSRRIGRIVPLLIGVALSVPLCLVPHLEPPVRSAPGNVSAGQSREFYLASLFIHPLASSEEIQSETLRRDRFGYWNGVADEVLLRRIQTQEIQKITFNRGGSSLSLRLHFKDGSSAAFKPEQVHEQTVPRKEIAAYRINRLLGLSRVPPATHRVLTFKQIWTKIPPKDQWQVQRLRKEAKFGKGWKLAGEVSWWIPRIRYVPIDRWKNRKRWYQWLKAYKRLRPQHVEATAQLSVMLLYDFIINNPDRFSGNNTMGTPDAKFLYFMDNTYSFFPRHRGGKIARTGLHRVQRFSRKFYRYLKALTYERLKAELDRDRNAPWPILTEPEMRAVIARRDFAVQHINRVIARYGWEKTMVFP